MAFEKIFSAELERLHVLGREFGKENPTIASYLSGQGGDPDVERLLQGFAFLSAMVRQKMDDELPEFIGDVLALVGPDLAQPMPSMTVLKIGITGKSQEGETVKHNTRFASVPTLGTRCYFSTSWPLIVQPVELVSVNINSLGSGSRLTLNFEIQGQPLSQWMGKSLAFYLSGPYPEAATLLMAMRQHLRRVKVYAQGDHENASPLKLRFDGLDSNKSLFSAQHTIAQHIRWVKEFLAFPERSFFLRLEGFDRWVKPVGVRQFSVEFDFSVPVTKLPKPSTTHVTVNAVPAANLFNCYANPIELTHLKESYLLTPMDFSAGQAIVHDVLSVTGRTQGESEERVYQPTTELMSDGSHLKYQVVASDGVLRSDIEHHLRLPFGDKVELNRRETLSINMRCTNGRLPEMLRPGDVSERTAESPEKVTVSNITAPTGFSRPALGKDAMWKIVAHARLNLQALLDTVTLKELLAVYLPEGGGDPARLAAARRRLEGIESISMKQDTRMLRGTRIRGQIIRLQLKLDFFASEGDLMLFGEMLSPFFAGLVGLNSYVTLVVADPVSGVQFEWPTLLAPSLTL